MPPLVGTVGISKHYPSGGTIIRAVSNVSLSIEHGEMPVNMNYRVRDPDCDLNLVLESPRRQKVRMTLSNSFGFGGSNSCIVLRSPELVG